MDHVSKRSKTGNHTLLPAFREDAHYQEVLKKPVPSYSLVSWTFGRGSVIWRIWPAVLLHTLFAGAVVTLSLKTSVKLDIPNVMITVLGVVIGFVIAYRVGSGYDRYWMGRVAWSDLVRNSRQMGRLIWFHIPDKLTPKTPEETSSGIVKRSEEELLTVMAEKRMALDLVEGFCVATKHHLRGEIGIYYEDLYHLIKPLHDHDHQQAKLKPTPSENDAGPSKAHGKASSSKHLEPPIPPPTSTSPLRKSGSGDPIIPPVNAYGTFRDSNASSSSDHTVVPSESRISHFLHTKTSFTRIMRSRSNSDPSRQALLRPAAREGPGSSLFGQVSGDLIPFAGMVSSIVRALKIDWAYKTLLGKQQLEVLPPTWVTDDQEAGQVEESSGGVQRVWGPNATHAEKKTLAHGKHRPRVAGDGENLPLEILRCLSEWFAVLEDRGTVPGTTMGGMIGLLAAFEDSLSAMERILTTPLPFVYSVHIRHTVWIYLFTLPFQLVTMFGWHTVPGVAVASFIFLGFLAAGDEIEQPFGYDDNDLDLDLFCKEVIHEDLERLKGISSLNSYIAPSQKRKGQKKRRSLMEESKSNAQKVIVAIQTVHEGENAEQEVFGTI